MQAELRGVSFRDAEVKSLVKSMNVGDEVTLRREPSNEYDSNAIMVLHTTGVHLGYVEADVAAEIAGRLDNGEMPLVVIDSFISTIKPLLEIDFE